MAKFTFPMPGRSKKQSPPAAPVEPMSKASRILGTNHFNGESKGWDAASNSGISVSVSESAAPTTTASGRRDRQNNGVKGGWEDESEVVPRHVRADAPDEAYPEYTGPLREQPSSSTIRSWYDKTKQPLAISQQTSASAMAKGLPSKAQRVLDMDNAYATPASKTRKKPSKLDLSQIKPGSRSKNQDWEAPVLGNNYVTRSPSILSPLTSPGKRARRRIQKRPTQESLGKQEETNTRPRTTGNHSQPRSNHLGELPSLYKHYEQMSFAQLMDEEEEEPAKEVLWADRNPEQPPAAQATSVEEDAGLSIDYHTHMQRERQEEQEQREEDYPGPLNSHPPPSHSSHGSHSTQRSHATTQFSQPPQIAHGPAPAKPGQQSPTDYAASISSRHTRTSKASRRTDKSFQTADLQEKSVLMLSSDSEDDEDNAYTESPQQKTSATAPSTRRPSLAEMNGSSEADSLHQRPPTAGSTPSQRSHQSGLSGKRMSSAPAGFLTIPPRRLSKSPSPVQSPTTVNSRESSQWGQASHLPGSPSGISTSNSSVSTTVTWQGHEGYGIQEARAVTMVPAQGPEPESEQDTGDSDLEYDKPASVVRRESAAAPSSNSAGPTPPLSPSSMDHYMQSPQSLGGAHEHFMGVTHQEQMLIQALRQRREVMRRTSFSESSESVSQSHPSHLNRGHHQSNPSESTITESTFNLGFPAPPANREMGNRTQTPSFSTSSAVDLPIPGGKDEEADRTRSPSCTADGTLFVLSPPPSSHHKPSMSNLRNQIRRESSNISRNGYQNGQPPLHSDRSGVPFMAIGEDVPNPDIKGFEEKRSPPRVNARDSLTIPQPRGSVRRQRSQAERHESKSARDRPSTRSRQHWQWPILEDEPSAGPLPRGHQEQPHVDDDAGIPRPDSPISPMTEAFPAVPTRRRTLNNHGARLSAFGPPQANGGFAWWGDQD